MLVQTAIIMSSCSLADAASAVHAGHVVQMQSSLHQERVQRQHHEEAAQKAEAAKQQAQQQCTALQAKLMASISTSESLMSISMLLQPT